MRDRMIVAALVVGVSALAGCATGGGSPMARAQATCIERAQEITGGSAYVVRSEFSEANTLVIVGGRKGTRWRCLSSNDGRIAELQLM